MRTVIFDLDGTLADTSGDLLAAANFCFRKLGHGDVLDQDDAATAVRGARAMLKLGFERLDVPYTSADLDTHFDTLVGAYGEAIDVHTYIYDGAQDAVDRLVAGGVKVGICTNKPEGLAEKLMTSLGFRDVFGALLGADSLAVRKPDPMHFVQTVKRAGGDPDRALLVGDTITDRETSRAAGVPSVLVTFGPGGDDVKALDADAYLDSYEELDGIVEQFLGKATP